MEQSHYHSDTQFSSLSFPDWVGDAVTTDEYAYSTDERAVLEQVKDSYPLAVQQAIDEVARKGSHSLSDEVAEYVLVDIVRQFQEFHYEATDSFVPIELFSVDSDADELLFDDRSAVYYTLDVRDWDERVDEWMCAESTLLAMQVLELATWIRAESAYDSKRFFKDIRESHSVFVAIDLTGMPE